MVYVGKLSNMSPKSAWYVGLVSVIMLSIKVSEVILLCEKFSVMHFQYIYFDLIKIFVILSRFLLGPEQVSTCEVPIVFRMKPFLSQMIAFFTALHT